MMNVKEFQDTYRYTESNKKTKLTAFFIVGIILSFFLYNTYEQAVFSILGIALLFLSALFLDCRELWVVAVFLTPNIAMLKFLDFPNAIHSYYLILIELKYFIYEKKCSFKMEGVFLLCVISACLTSLCIGDYSVLISYLRTLLLLLLLYNFMRDKKSDAYNKRVIDSFVYGATANVICGVFYYVIRNKNIFNGYFAAINNDRNYFSTVLAVAIALIVLYLQKYKTSELSFKITCLVILCAGGVISMSRTFIIAMVWVALMFAIMMFNARKKRNLLILLLIGIFIFFMYFDTVMAVVTRVLARFTDSTVQGGNGRIEIWGDYLSLTFSTPLRMLFGNGLAINYVNSGVFVYIEHNTLIQMISSIGFLGSCSMLVCYYTVYSNVLTKNKFFQNIFAYMPLLVAFTGYFNISAFFLAHFDISVFVCIIAIDLYKKKEIASQGVTKSQIAIKTYT